MAGALSGIRILDLTRILAGPTATQVLADLGADVIKVERPGIGDEVRGWGPPYLDDSDGNETAESVYFQSANRNKRSVTINMADPRGQDLVRRLAGQSDVLFENYRVGTLEKYGLGFEQLGKEFPSLIYCSLTGFGQDGPYAPRAGFDLVVQAMGGIMSITGSEDGEPVKVGVGITDIMTGMYCNIAILAALRHRDATGEGQHIDMALLDTQVAWLVNEGMNYLHSGNIPKPWGTGHATIVPYQAFPASDGRFILATGTNDQYRRFCEFVGRQDLAEDPKFRRNRDRVRNRQEIVDIISEITRELPMDYWLGSLPPLGIPCGPVNTIDKVFEEPQVRHRGMRIELEHPATGKAEPYIASPIRMSRSPVEYRLPAPALGQHNNEVLGELLGLSAEEIEALRNDDVI